MNRIIALWIVLLSFCCSCNRNQDRSENSTQSWMARNGKVKVLSTIAMINDLVKTVGGEHVDAITLIKGELNPHSYQIVKGDDEKLAFADIVFFNGLGLEHGPSLQNFLENDAKAVGLGNQILKHKPELILYMGGQADPHIWMDVSLWASTIDYIVEAMSRADPGHHDDYQRNADSLKKEMAKTHEGIRNELQLIPEKQRYLVTSHDAFNYFARAYLAEEAERQGDSWHDRFAAPEGLAPESQLSATHIHEILEFLMKHHVYVLFSESNVSKDSIKKIVDAGKSKGMNLRISTDYLYADAMGAPGSEGDTYQKMIQHDAVIIARHLRHNYP
jgi:manganese/zinc/iron transport system substrate-binding protein